MGAKKPACLCVVFRASELKDVCEISGLSHSDFKSGKVAEEDKDNLCNYIIALVKVAAKAVKKAKE